MGAFTWILYNYDDNETVNYSLFLLKGSIYDDNKECSSLNGTIVCTSCKDSSFWPVYRGKFRCLALLAPGSNSILLRFRGEEKQINVNFTPHKTDLCIVPIYFIPEGHDGRFQAPSGTDNSASVAVEKIAFGVSMIQTLFAEKLKEHNFNKKSFQLESDIDSAAPKCRTYHGRLTLEKAKTLNEEELWEEIGREIMMSDLGSDKKKFVCFISSTFWDGKEVQMDPALGGGGLALLGSASLHSWPISVATAASALIDDSKLDPHVLDNSCYRGTYSGLLATSLGSVAHEIGHIFNLGHTQSGLMARGFDDTHLVFVQSSQENTSETFGSTPYLSVINDSSKRTEIPIRASSSNFSTADNTFIESGCAAILAYHKWFNPASNNHTPIFFDKLRHVIKSEGGLRVVEVRGARGAVRKSMVLKGAGRHLVIPSGHSGATLFAIDANGTILTSAL